MFAASAAMPVETSLQNLQQSSLEAKVCSECNLISLPANQVQILDLESEVRSKDIVEADLRALVASLESRLNEHVEAIRSIQVKYQEALQERRASAREATIATNLSTTLTGRLEARNNDISSLKSEKAVLEAELSLARTSLTTSAIPEVAQLEAARAETRTLKEENEKLEKRLESVRTDFEFTRQSYQKASSTAADLSSELANLQAANADLRARADINRLRIQEVQRDNTVKEMARRIDELEATVRDREREIARGKDEVRVLRNGRNTRGTSAPRSPRLSSGILTGGAMSSPKVGNGGRGSRQASPNVGEFTGGREPVVLPGASGGNGGQRARWRGDHLRD
jgi:DNA repair exonuclease SbcCD ATPase subunit